MLDPSSHTAYRNGLIFTTVGDSVGAMTVSRVGPGNVVTEMIRTGEGGTVVMTREPGTKEAAEARRPRRASRWRIELLRVASTVGPAGRRRSPRGLRARRRA